MIAQEIKTPGKLAYKGLAGVRGYFEFGQHLVDRVHRVAEFPSSRSQDDPVIQEAGLEQPAVFHGLIQGS